MVSATPDLRLPSQLQSYTVTVPVTLIGNMPKYALFVACRLSSYLFGVNTTDDVPDVIEAQGADDELNRADRVGPIRAHLSLLFLYRPSG